MVVSFTSDFAALPADGRADHPHVIDVLTYDASKADQNYEMSLVPKFTLWDAVATLLHTISPDTRHEFLDTSNKELKIILSPKQNNAHTIIWKKGTEVLIGEFIDQAIDAEGAWKVMYASYGLYTPRDWASVWAGGFTDARPGRGVLFPDNDDRSHVQFTVAGGIMCGCPWPRAGFDWTVSTG